MILSTHSLVHVKLFENSLIHFQFVFEFFRHWILSCLACHNKSWYGWDVWRFNYKTKWTMICMLNIKCVQLSTQLWVSVSPWLFMMFFTTRCIDVEISENDAHKRLVWYTVGDWQISWYLFKKPLLQLSTEFEMEPKILK